MKEALQIAGVIVLMILVLSIVIPVGIWIADSLMHYLGLHV